MFFIDPDEIQVEVVSDNQVYDQYAGRPVAVVGRDSSFTVRASLEPLRREDRLPTDIGATPKTSYLATVRRSDWATADSRSDPKPRDGDRVTGLRKLYSTTESFETVDLYINGVSASGSTAGGFSYWAMTLVDREARD